MKQIKKAKNKVLIEDENFRFWVDALPYDQYNEGMLSHEELMSGAIPASVYWGDYIKISPDLNLQIEEELHRRGIHDVNDLLTNGGGVSSAILAAIGLPANKLYHVVRNEQQKQLGGNL